jgi:hypothetical protein
MIWTPAPRPPGWVHAYRASMPAGAASRYPCRREKSAVAGGASFEAGAMSLIRVSITGARSRDVSVMVAEATPAGTGSGVTYAPATVGSFAKRSASASSSSSGASIE